MDLILALAEDLLIDFVWTDELLDEWERVIVRGGYRTPETARSVAEAVRRFFAATRIERSTYSAQVASAPGGDPDDRVLPQPARSEVPRSPTRNTRDFPVDFLADHGVRVLAADDYLGEVLRPRPAAVLDTVTRLSAAKRNPPKSPCDLAAELVEAGAVRFGTSLGRRLGCHSR